MMIMMTTIASATNVHRDSHSHHPFYLMMLVIFRLKAESLSVSLSNLLYD